MEFKTNNGGTITDEFGVTYSEDGGILLKADPKVFKEKKYAIPCNTRIIWEGAFQGIDSLEEATFEDAFGKAYVSYIGEFAFERCKNLREILLPDSVKEMGQCVFRNCISLKKVRLPKGLKAVPCECFMNCASLEEVDLPEGLENVEICGFYSCQSLRHIKLPDSLYWLEDTAFSHCGLESIKPPAGIKFLGEDCFRDCPLDELVIPEKVETILPWLANSHKGFKGVRSLSPHFRVENDALINENADLLCCWADTDEYVIPESVTNICGFANDRVKKVICNHPIGQITYDCFGACESLREVRLAKVDHIDDSAFIYCSTLKLFIGGVKTPTPQTDPGDISVIPYYTCPGKE